MQNESPDVAEFVRELSHPLKPGVEELRAAILASDDGITEQIKWNAPSFHAHAVDLSVDHGTGEVTIKSAAGVTVDATGPLKLKGATVDIEASATVNVKGSLINIG